MRVFNLTKQQVEYRGKIIPAEGSLDLGITFIPDRDRMLEKMRVLAFGELPSWYVLQRQVDESRQVMPVKLTVVEDVQAPVEALAVSKKR